MYLAGSAMSFERGWISLFQLLATKPSGDLAQGALCGAQSEFPFMRGHMYPARQATLQAPPPAHR